MRAFPPKNRPVIQEEPGCLIYREGNEEFTFPVFEEDGQIVFVSQPSFHRTFLIFHWTASREPWTAGQRERVLGACLGYLRRAGRRVHLFDGADDSDGSFIFRPELFASRGQAADALAEGGFDMFGDYSSIDILHEEYGLEICGIREKAAVEPISAIMEKTFPHWHHGRACGKDYGIEPGWTVSLHMFRRQCCSDDWRSDD